MNYLAHARLSEQSAEGLAGALIGDFLKGRVPPTLPAGIVRAVRLHRRLDSLSDAHAAHVASRRRFSPSRRRFAGIIVDVTYDHFLARHWDRYGLGELEAFTGGVYAALVEHQNALPERLRTVAPRMAAGDWLASYRSLDAVGLALDGIARRFKRATTLPGAVEEVRSRYQALERDFEAFFPDLERTAANERQLLLSPAGADTPTALSH